MLSSRVQIPQLTPGDLSKIRKYTNVRDQTWKALGCLMDKPDPSWARTFMAEVSRNGGELYHTLATEISYTHSRLNQTFACLAVQTDEDMGS